jgi:hypothetical protein
VVRLNHLFDRGETMPQEKPVIGCSDRGGAIFTEHISHSRSNPLLIEACVVSGKNEINLYFGVDRS